MFLIAGISLKTKTVEGIPRLCPNCGLAQAYLKRVDHYFTLFFIPILRIEKGAPVMICEKCQRQLADWDESLCDSTDTQGRCKYCGSALQRTFVYCPNCGKSTGAR